MRSLILLPFVCSATTALVTGATGRTGVLTYKALQEKGVTVRALVRNVTKAKELLGCTKCDAAEGIFVGDIPKPDTLTAAMAGVDSLVITVGPGVNCAHGPFGCKYLPGADPKAILYEGLQNQVVAFANATGVPNEGKRVVLMSSQMTTEPDNFLDKLGNGHVTFYTLLGEAFLLSAGIDFTIVKPCGLGDKAPGQRHLLVGHDDQGFNELLDHSVSRADVARVLAAAVAPRTREIAGGLRFDFCSSMLGAPQADLADVFRAAEYPWMVPAAPAAIVV